VNRTRRTASPESATGSADVRRAVLDGALEIIATQGPDALSMREVARRAGVSHQAPYHYFGDRAGILAAITEEGFTKFADSFEEQLQTSDDPLVDCLKMYVSFALAHPGHYRVMFRSDLSGTSVDGSPAHQAGERAFQALLDLAATVDSDASPEDAMMLPMTLWAHAHGIATLLLDGPLPAKLPTGTTVDEFITHIGQYFSRGVRVHINK
jgi:AcrR family transcriptional regulator